ncbi:protein transport protein Sec24C-like isoform X2 [Zootermopsis nevadensis]|uniref:protein transport protein Sec24C-like isoform X2 n=1 Tax=Zootermopsis nevadensis TaxID=136037 RepID=UPI000B8E29BE|nr:protein transport protein Sec24C-like isoform X2 [Zootermopsis nevadensis]
MPAGPGMMTGGPMASSHRPDSSGSNMTNRLAGPPIGSQPTAPQQPPIMRPPATLAPSQLSTQLSGMHLSGQSRPPVQISNYSSGPPTKPGFGSEPLVSPPANFYHPPGSFPQGINGGPAPPTSSPDQPFQPPGQQQHGSLPPSQYMNGSMGPPPAHIPVQGGNIPVAHRSVPPTGVPPQSGGIPTQHRGMLPPFGGMPQSGTVPPLTQPGPPTGKSYPSLDMYHPNAGVPPKMQQPPMGPQGPAASYRSPHQHMGPQQPPHPFMQSQPARLFVPENLPSPVTKDDEHNGDLIFDMNEEGVTTHFSTRDGSNASPRYIRSSMHSIPSRINMMKEVAVPFCLVVSPLARTSDEDVLPPVIDMGKIGPVRCIRCKAFMCPFMQFIDGGKRFRCPFCKATTEVPQEYFQQLDDTGLRVDQFQRPELNQGAYEFVATKDYCRNKTLPKPPALIFLIDVSYNNIISGLVHLLHNQIKEILKLLPKDEGAETSNMRVGFITYSKEVFLYSFKTSFPCPMVMWGDVEKNSVSMPEVFLCDAAESEAAIKNLMKYIFTLYDDTTETETVLAPAIQTGLRALQASKCAGKLLVFHSSLPTAEAPGKLKNRDDKKLLGTEKEKKLLAPQGNVYSSLGQECAVAGCSVDLFIFNNSYIDLATIGQVSRFSGGEIHKYSNFQADVDGERLIADIKHDVSRPVAFDAAMRVRTSTGVRATNFYGHHFTSNTGEMILGSIDCNKALTIEIKHEDDLTKEDGVYIQVALLYTSCGGQRRIRILNLSLNKCIQMRDFFRRCDQGTIINFIAKQTVFRLLESSRKSVKENLVNQCAQMLACYRKCERRASERQLILPVSMEFLPLYVYCILKSDVVSGSDMTIDDRSFLMQAVTIMDIPSSVEFFYPRLIPLHDIDVDSDELPSSIPCSSDKIRNDGVYLLDNGFHLVLWIGSNVDMKWVENVFGVHSAAHIDTDSTSLPVLDNALSARIKFVIDSVRKERHRCMRVSVQCFSTVILRLLYRHVFCCL